MGPRLFSRGDVPAGGTDDIVFYTLQWGRGCSAAEIMDKQAAGATVLRLQWGRGCSAAEMRSPRKKNPIPTTRFNGAAAVQPRR